MEIINDKFSKEYHILAEEGNDAWIALSEMPKKINAIPALTDSSVLQSLQDVHYEAYLKALKVAEISLKLSCLYRNISFTTK